MEVLPLLQDVKLMLLEQRPLPLQMLPPLLGTKLVMPGQPLKELWLKKLLLKRLLILQPWH